MSRLRFAGQIAGAGSSSGVRLVVGRWRSSPYGAFTDVMVADATGQRVLLAPTEEIAAFVSSTYAFDRVHVGPVAAVGSGTAWNVEGPDLRLRLVLGRRLALGYLLRGVPIPVATAPWWTRLTDPVARRVLGGVRTRGTAGNGRREFYGATDLHAVAALDGTWAGRPLGDLAPVLPEPGFGFGSTPAQPSVTTLVTTVTLGPA